MSGSIDKIRAAVVQMDTQLGRIENNVTMTLEILKGLNCDLAVLPEMWTCGFDNNNLVKHAAQTPEILDLLSGFCKDNKMVIAGTMPELFQNAIFNTMYVVESDGKIVGNYRKIHLFRPTDEHLFYTPGDAVGICNTSLGPVGMMICYDIRFPELCRKLALSGAFYVLVSAQWPLSRINHWKVLTEARAIENHLFLICANRCGRDPDLLYGGNSRIVSPSGELLLHTDESGPSCLKAVIRSKEIEESRRRFSTLTERRAELYD
jgi:predicted amidohydrolase